MAGKRPAFTENFSENLTSVQTFLGPEGNSFFDRLLERLFEEVVPTLSRFPQAGRSLLSHRVHSKESKAMVTKLRDRLEVNDDLREFIMDDYVILYLIRGFRIVFLAIKHHRQLSFDMRRFWQEE
ncbi:MAG: type II toxin-antitoxin system RelE/ParE family toxin [Nitrospiraceae bacterium]